MTSSPTMDTLIERFVRWAETQTDIRAATIVGSRARLDRPADAWSDLDLVSIVYDPNRYLMTTDRVSQVGVPLLTFLEPTAVGNQTERRVMFKGAYDVDFRLFRSNRWRSGATMECQTRLLWLRSAAPGSFLTKTEPLRNSFGNSRLDRSSAPIHRRRWYLPKL